MNLDSMLREGALTDVNEWWDEGLRENGEVTFDVAGHNTKSPNNIKPEAQEQWGYVDISPIFDEKNSGTVERNLPEDTTEDAGKVIMFARHLMNQGATSSTVDRELKAHFTRQEMRCAATGLRELFEMDGIIGRIAVDARGYDSCKDALSAAEQSPHKRFIKFVMGCTCGDPQMVPVPDQELDVVASTGNAADDFFADETTHSAKEIPHCPSTRLPLYAAIDDLDPSWVEDLMVVVENITGVPGDTTEDSPTEKAKKAFKMMDRVAANEGRQRYSGPVDASEYVIETAETEIELAPEPKPCLDVDPSAGDFLAHEVPSPLQDDTSVDMTPNLEGTIFEGSDEIDLDTVRETHEPDVRLSESEIAW